MDTGAKLTRTFKTTPAVGKWSASMDDMVLQSASGNAIRSAPVLAMYSYKLYTGPETVETHYRLYDLRDDKAAQYVKVVPSASKYFTSQYSDGILTVTGTSSAKAGMSYPLYVTLTEKNINKKAVAKINVKIGTDLRFDFALAKC